EVLDAEAEPRDAEAPDRLQLRLRERARLALERDLLGRVPRGDRGETPDERLELARREERRRAAAEVDEVQRPARDGGPGGVELPLAREQVEVVGDLLRVAIGVDAEVAEVAALPAERDVQVQPQRH